MALFGRDIERETYNDYMPLEEFAPTLSRQEIIKQKKLSALIEPIRDIPTALKGRRDQIESDLNNFSMNQSQEFEEIDSALCAAKDAINGHAADAKTLSTTMEQVGDALSSLKAEAASFPEMPQSNMEAFDLEVPQIDLRGISEEYLPEQKLIDQIRSYSSFSHILRKSLEYTISSLDQYHKQVQNLSEKKQMLEALASEADLLALNTTIDATHMNEESQEFSTKVASEIGDLSRRIHDISAALDADLDILENGFNTVRSSLGTIESAHRDSTKYADMYSSACNEYYRQSTNYTNILIQSLSRLNKDFRNTIKKKDAILEDYMASLTMFQKSIEKRAENIVEKSNRIGSVVDGCIRGSSSMHDEITETLELIAELQKTLEIVKKSDLIRKEKYSAALLNAFDKDLVWLRDKIESVFEQADKE